MFPDASRLSENDELALRDEVYNRIQGKKFAYIKVDRVNPDQSRSSSNDLNSYYRVDELWYSLPEDNKLKSPGPLVMTNSYIVNMNLGIGTWWPNAESIGLSSLVTGNAPIGNSINIPITVPILNPGDQIQSIRLTINVLQVSSVTENLSISQDNRSIVNSIPMNNVGTLNFTLNPVSPSSLTLSQPYNSLRGSSNGFATATGNFVYNYSVDATLVRQTREPITPKIYHYSNSSFRRVRRELRKGTDPNQL